MASQSFAAKKIATMKDRERRPATKAAAKAQSPNSRSVNMDEVRELVALLCDNDLSILEIEREGFRVNLRRGIQLAPSEISLGNAGAAQVIAPAAAATHVAVPLVTPAAAALPVHPGASAETAASEDSDLQLISSPIVGTFYRARSPNAEPFVKVGSNVQADSVVCIIE